jgi:hypothetical protein
MRGIILKNFRSNYMSLDPYPNPTLILKKCCIRIRNQIRKKIFRVNSTGYRYRYSFRWFGFCYLNFALYCMCHINPERKVTRSTKYVLHYQERKYQYYWWQSVTAHFKTDDVLQNNHLKRKKYLVKYCLVKKHLCWFFSCLKCCLSTFVQKSQISTYKVVKSLD